MEYIYDVILLAIKILLIRLCWCVFSGKFVFYKYLRGDDKKARFRPCQYKKNQCVFYPMITSMKSTHGRITLTQYGLVPVWSMYLR